MLSQTLETEIPEVQFHKSKRVNEAKHVTLKRTRDAAVQLMEETSEEDMKTLFNAASILKKAINNSDKWMFAGSFTDVTSKHVPKELYCFFSVGDPRATQNHGHRYKVIIGEQAQ